MRWLKFHSRSIWFWQGPWMAPSFWLQEPSQTHTLFPSREAGPTSCRGGPKLAQHVESDCLCMHLRESLCTCGCLALMANIQIWPICRVDGTFPRAEKSILDSWPKKLDTVATKLLEMKNMRYFLQWICCFLNLMVTQTCMPSAGSLEAFSHLFFFFFKLLFLNKKALFLKRKTNTLNWVRNFHTLDILFSAGVGFCTRAWTSYLPFVCVKWWCV